MSEKLTRTMLDDAERLIRDAGGRDVAAYPWIIERVDAVGGQHTVPWGTGAGHGTLEDVARREAVEAWGTVVWRGVIIRTACVQVGEALRAMGDALR